MSMQENQTFGIQIGRNCEVRESFSPDLVLQQRRMQENSQFIQNEGVASARFKFEDEEESARNKGKRAKPRAIEVSEYSGGCESNTNSQKNFINSHRTNQSGMSSRGGNSSRREQFTNTVVKDKCEEQVQCERGEGEETNESGYKQSFLKQTEQGIRNQQNELLVKNQQLRNMNNNIHQEREYNDPKEQEEEEVICTEQVDSEYMMLSQSEQNSRNIRISSEMQSQQAQGKKVVSQPSLRKRGYQYKQQDHLIARSNDGDILNRSGYSDINRNGFNELDGNRSNKSLKDLNRSYQQQEKNRNSINNNMNIHGNEIDNRQSNSINRNSNDDVQAVNRYSLNDFSKNTNIREDICLHQIPSDTLGQAGMFTEGERHSRHDTLETLLTKEGLDLRSLQQTEENENMLLFMDQDQQQQQQQYNNTTDLDNCQNESNVYGFLSANRIPFKESNSRMNSSMGQLNRSFNNVDSKLIQGSGNRLIRNVDSDDDNKENLRARANVISQSVDDDHNKGRCIQNKQRTQSTMQIQQEYYHIYSLLQQERNKNVILNNQLRDFKAQVHSQQEFITKLEEEFIQLDGMKKCEEQELQAQLRDAQQHLLESGEQLQLVTNQLIELDKQKQQLIQEKQQLQQDKSQLQQEKKLLVYQNTQYLVSIKQNQLSHNNNNNNNTIQANIPRSRVKRSRDDSSNERAKNTFQTEDEIAPSISPSLLKTNASTNYCSSNSSKYSHPTIKQSDNSHLDVSGYSTYSQNAQPQYYQQPSADLQEIHKFIQCVMGMVQQCAPNGYFNAEEPNSLKRSWKFLKQMVGRYLELKQQEVKNNENVLILEQIAQQLNLDSIKFIPQEINRVIFRKQSNSQQKYTNSISSNSIPSKNYNYNYQTSNKENSNCQNQDANFTFKQFQPSYQNTGNHGSSNQNQNSFFMQQQINNNNHHNHNHHRDPSHEFKQSKSDSFSIKRGRNSSQIGDYSSNQTNNHKNNSNNSFEKYESEKVLNNSYKRNNLTCQITPLDTSQLDRSLSQLQSRRKSSSSASPLSRPPIEKSIINKPQQSNHNNNNNNHNHNNNNNNYNNSYNNNNNYNYSNNNRVMNE